MANYEYKKLADPNIGEMNSLGRKGWRLVSTHREEMFGVTAQIFIFEKETQV